MTFEVALPRKQFTNDVTFFGEGIRLSNRFILSEGLGNYAYVEIFVDEEMRRIGFKFLEEPSSRSLKLTKSGGSTHGKTISCVFLKRCPWIREVMDEREIGARRFSIQRMEGTQGTSGIDYFIFLKYKFAPRRNFENLGDYPRVPGIYRLYKSGEVVKIGKSDDIERRLKGHHRSYRGQVDAYDFAEIPGASDRKREEKRLLKEFKERYGRLPKLNLNGS